MVFGLSAFGSDSVNDSLSLLFPAAADDDLRSFRRIQAGDPNADSAG